MQPKHQTDAETNAALEAKATVTVAEQTNESVAETAMATSVGMTGITDEQIQRAIRKAHLMRAHYIADMAEGAWQAIAGVFTGRKPKTQVTMSHDFRTSLTSLRSSAEILRDHPDIDGAQRSRLLEVVLSEEKRLEDLVAKFVDRRGPAASGAA